MNMDFTDEAVEQMVLDAFDELCDDQGLAGSWAEDGPKGLALTPDPLRLGAAVDLWMRVENREESARQGIVEHTTIFGSSQLDVARVDDTAVEGEEEEVEYDPEPILDEIELRGRLLVDVLNEVSRFLSDRRGALELGEDVPSFADLQQALVEALNVSFADARLRRLWENGVFVAEDE